VPLKVLITAGAEVLAAAIINDGEQRRAVPATRSANSLYENWLADTGTD
jgi:hypothetical protein